VLEHGTKLFKWTKSITNARGISPWWQFLAARRLATGANVPGIRELQTYASRLGVHDRDYNRTRLALTEQWSKMTQAAAIELLRGTWGYVGKAARRTLRRPVRADSDGRESFAPHLCRMEG
jgi:hypothetical protein